MVCNQTLNDNQQNHLSGDFSYLTNTNTHKLVGVRQSVRQMVCGKSFKPENQSRYV